MDNNDSYTIPPSPLGYYRQYASNANTGETESYLSDILHGITLGMYGNEPSSTFGRILDFGGQFATFGVADALTGGLLTPILGESMAGRLATQFGKDVVLAGIQTYADPDSGSFLHNLGTFGTMDLLFHLPSIYKKFSNLGTKALETGMDTSKVAQLTHTVEIPSPTEDVQQSINDIYQTNNLVNDRLDTLLNNVDEKVTHLIYKGIDQQRSLLDANVEASHNAITKFLDDIGRELHGKEIELVYGSLADIKTQIMPQELLTTRLQSAITPTNKIAGEPRFRQVMGALDELKYKLARYDTAYGLGLPPTATLEELGKAQERFDAVRATLFDEIPQDKTLTKLYVKLYNTAGDLLKNAPRLPGEFGRTDKFIEFMGAISSLLNAEGTLSMRGAVANEAVTLAAKRQPELLQNASNLINSVFAHYDPIAYEDIQHLENSIIHGKPFQPVSLGRTEDYLINTMASRLRDLQPDSYKTFDEAKQVANQLITKPEVAEKIILDTGDSTFTRAYYLLQSSLGNELYKLKYTQFRMDSLSNIALSMANKLVELAPNIAYDEEHTVMPIETKALATGGGAPKATPTELPPGMPAEMRTQAEQAAKMRAQTGSTQMPPGTIPQMGQDLGAIARNLGAMADNAWNAAQKALPGYSTFYKSLHEHFLQWIHAQENVRKTLATKVNVDLTNFDRDVKKLPPVLQNMLSLHIMDIDNTAREWAAKGISKETIQEMVNHQYGHMDEQIRPLYQRFRDMDDWVLHTYNKGVYGRNKAIDDGLSKMEKIPYMTAMPGHSATIYTGSWLVKVGDSSVEYIAQNQADAFRYIQEYLAAGGKGDIHFEPRYLQGSELQSVGLSMHNKVMDLFTRSADDFNKAINSKQLRADNFSEYIFSGALHRSGDIKGAMEDPLRALYLRMVAATKFSEYEPLTSIGQSYLDTMKAFGLTNWHDALKTYMDDMLGRSRPLERLIDRTIDTLLSSTIYQSPTGEAMLRSLGIKPGGRIVRPVIGALKYISRLSVIGFNFTTSLINEFIIAHNILPVAGAKNFTKALFTLHNAVTDINHPFHSTIEHANLPLMGITKTLKDAITVPEFLVSKPTAILDWLESKGMWMFNKSEYMAKGIGLMAFRHQAEDLAKELTSRAPKNVDERTFVDIAQRLGLPLNSPQVMDDYAWRMMRKHTFLFTSADLPELWRNPLVQPWAQFKSYYLKQMSYMIGQVQHDPINALKTSALLIGLGGLMALPGTQELDYLSRALFGWSPANWLNQNVPEVLGFGAPTLAGIDLSQRVNFGSFVNALDPRALWTVTPTRLIQAAKAALKGNTAGAMAHIEPTFLKNIQDGVEYLQTGKITNKYDQTLEVPEGELNLFEAFARTLGVPSMYETTIRRMKQASQSYAQKIQQMKQEALLNAMNAYQSGNMDLALEYLHDVNIPMHTFKQYVKRKDMDPYQRVMSLLGKQNMAQFQEEYQ